VLKGRGTLWLKGREVRPRGRRVKNTKNKYRNENMCNRVLITRLGLQPRKTLVNEGEGGKNESVTTVKLLSGGKKQKNPFRKGFENESGLRSGSGC